METLITGKTIREKSDSKSSSRCVEHRMQCEQLQASLADREQSLHQLSHDFTHLRADHSNLTLENQSMGKVSRRTSSAYSRVTSPPLSR